MANAKKLPSGSWRVRTCTDGKRRSYTAPTKKEAERLAAIGEEEEKERAARSMTVKEALDGYIETCRAQGYSASTIAEYTSRARSSYQRISGTKLDKLTANDVQAQLDSRSKECSAKTVRNDLYLLRAALAVYAPSIRLDKIKLAKRKRRAKLILSETLPEQILRAVEGQGADFRIYVALIMFAGLRPSEVYALHWADLSAKPITVAADPPYQVGQITVTAAEVRDEHGTYTRKAPKTESGNRTQLLSWAVFDLIYAVKPRGGDEEKLVTMKPNSATKAWEAVRKNLPELEGLRLYDLRHYFATAVANSGATEEELAARMGHSTSAFSHSVYVELFRERRENVNAVLSRSTEKAIQKARFSEQTDTNLDTAKK